MRELRNVLERAAVLCVEQTITPEFLPPALLANAGPPGTRAAPSPPSQAGTVGDTASLQTQMKALERAKILEALDRCRGNQSEAADLLGMPRRTLVSRLTEYGLTRTRKRE